MSFEKVQPVEGEKMSRRSFLRKSAKLVAGAAVVASGADAAASDIKRGVEFLTPNNIKKRPKEKGSANLSPEEVETRLESIRKKNREQKRAKNVLDSFLSTYQQLEKNEKYWPKNLFTNDLMIAMQMKESMFDSKAESPAGAFGIMQTTEIAIVDNVEYSNILKRAGAINYNGPKEISIDNEFLMEEIKKKIKNNVDYGRVAGKIHLSSLLNRYKVGKAKYEKGDIKGAQKDILVAYNAGHAILRRPEKNWTQETRGYYKKIFEFVEVIASIRKEFEDIKLDSGSDYCVMLLVRNMEKYKTKKAKEKYFSRSIGRIKVLEGVHSRPLSEKELQAVLV